MDKNQEINNSHETHENITPQDTAKEKIRRQKKTILIVFLCMVGIVILYFAFYFISSLFPKYIENEFNIYFYDEQYSTGDITKDEYYMDLNRVINFKRESTDITVSILEEDRNNYNEAVNLLYSMVEYMIMGNVEAYNGCFSPTYFSTQAPKERFTKQKLYNITIVEVSIEEKTDETGKNYTEYYYKLDYMIRHNNGSLRDDMGSDCIKSQHIYLSNRSGDMLIDKLIVYTPVTPK